MIDLKPSYAVFVVPDNVDADCVGLGMQAPLTHQAASRVPPPFSIAHTTNGQQQRRALKNKTVGCPVMSRSVTIFFGR